MVVYGYARVSTIGQTLAAQEAALHEAGAAKVFKEKISGAANHRAQLHRLLKTIDAGDLVIVTRLDRLARSTRDLLNILDNIAKAGATDSTGLVVSTGVSLVERRAGKALGLAARWTGPQQPPAAATRCIMEVLSHRLAAHGFRFADVVKQQTYYLGAASEKDLYANMTIRNAYYARPGPASTGLAVHGFLDPNCRITVEVLASRRS